MNKKCTATVMVADPTKPSDDIEKPCGKDAKCFVGIDTDSGGATFYLCERHYQEYLSERERGGE